MITLKDNGEVWRTVRLFLSSTFVDMNEERDLLIKQVFLIYLSIMISGYTKTSRAMFSQETALG